jgi:hypothetical protein
MNRLSTVLLVAAAALLVAPASVWAVDAFSNVAVEDPGSGVKAHVDATGHLLVAGQRPLPSSAPWSSWRQPTSVTSGSDPTRRTVLPLTSPTTAGIQLTGLTVSVPSGPPVSGRTWATVRIEEIAPATGQSNCEPTTTTQPKVLATVYEVTVYDGTPAAVSFPTPIQVHGVAALGQLCLGAHLVNGSSAVVDVDASGYFGT